MSSPNTLSDGTDPESNVVVSSAGLVSLSRSGHIWNVNSSVAIQSWRLPGLCFDQDQFEFYSHQLQSCRTTAMLSSLEQE